MKAFTISSHQDNIDSMRVRAWAGNVYLVAS